MSERSERADAVWDAIWAAEGKIPWDERTDKLGRTVRWSADVLGDIVDEGLLSEEEYLRIDGAVADMVDNYHEFFEKLSEDDDA